VLSFYYMTYLVAIALGFIEGMTEFLPISSSGHLIIARQILGVNNTGGLTFDAVLQMGASLALLVYFWNDILNLIKVSLKWLTRKQIEEKEKTLLLAIVLGTIPAIIFGLFLESYMDSVFRNIKLVGLTLILGSILFWIAEKYAKKDKVLSLGKGIIVGFFQCLALVPGISRSGATISGGLLTGLSQEEAVRFSFLLSVPILFGAGLKKMFEVRSDLLTSDFGGALLVGTLTAFIVGLFSINFLIKYLKNHNLNIFIIYRVVLSIFL
jgi:undecaprenyl-diphosphatase